MSSVFPAGTGRHITLLPGRMFTVSPSTNVGEIYDLFTLRLLARSHC